MVGELFFGAARQGEQVLAVLFVQGGEFVLFEQVAEQAVVEVVAAQRAVAVGGFDGKQAFAQFEYGYVERAAAQVVNDKRAFRAVVQPVGDGGGGGFVQQAQDVDARQPCRVFGGLALGFVEIGGNGDDRADKRAAQVGFGAFFQVAQDVGRDVYRGFRALPRVDFDDVSAVAEAVGQVGGVDVFEFAPDQAFGGTDGVLRIGFLRAQGFAADDQAV